MKTIKHIELTNDELKDVYTKIYCKLKTTYSDSCDTHGHCIEYTGKWNDGKGYKKIKYKNKTYYVHRVVWSFVNGHLDAFKVLDHVCRNPACCRPEHLEAVSVKENTIRGRGKWIFEQGYKPA